MLRTLSAASQILMSIAHGFPATTLWSTATAVTASLKLWFMTTVGVSSRLFQLHIKKINCGSVPWLTSQMKHSQIKRLAQLKARLDCFILGIHAFTKNRIHSLSLPAFEILKPLILMWDCYSPGCRRYLLSFIKTTVLISTMIAQWLISVLYELFQPCCVTCISCQFCDTSEVLSAHIAINQAC